MEKLIVLYKHPLVIETFETYYREKHLPLAKTMKGVKKMELSKAIATPEGNQPAYYRIAEIYFESMNQLQTTMESKEGRATAADLANFATGGVEVLIASVQTD